MTTGAQLGSWYRGSFATFEGQVCVVSNREPEQFADISKPKLLQVLFKKPVCTAQRTHRQYNDHLGNAVPLFILKPHYHSSNIICIYVS